MLSDRSVVCLSVLSVLFVCNVVVLWPNGSMDQDASWYEGRPRPRPRCVRWVPGSLPQKRHSPKFSISVYCGQTVTHLSYCWALFHLIDTNLNWHFFEKLYSPKFVISSSLLDHFPFKAYFSICEMSWFPFYTVYLTSSYHKPVLTLSVESFASG